MRLVRNKEEFHKHLESCQRESLSSFGNSSVILERYLENPRHIEYQIFGDKHGNAVHLYERDCSIQRRHQKVIEEAPASDLGHSIREEMGEVAVRAAKAIGYVGKKMDVTSNCLTSLLTQEEMIIYINQVQAQ